MLRRAALSTDLDCLAADSVPRVMAASVALEEMLRNSNVTCNNSTSKKRPRQQQSRNVSQQQELNSSSSLITFRNKKSSSYPSASKFDMTDLFAATTSESNCGNDDLAFPSLHWDLGDDDHGDHEPSNNANHDREERFQCCIGAATKALQQQQQQQKGQPAKDDGGSKSLLLSNLLMLDESRRRKSTSCLLGKRCRESAEEGGGMMMRSKTMRSDIDNMVSRLGDSLPGRLTS